jgi:hypothetical protein
VRTLEKAGIKPTRETFFAMGGGNASSDSSAFIEKSAQLDSTKTSA